MSSFIDNVETFDFTTLEFQSYHEKIEGLLKRFPKYEKDDRFRSVLPNKFLRTADDYISIKFCIIGRYPIYGIYNKRDLDLVGVCVEGDVMYALDDCDLHPSFVPDLKFHKLSLGIQYTLLATRETINYSRNCMCSAISTLSLGYTPQKKNEWCEAILLLTAMTSQAVRFPGMKYQVQKGLAYKRDHGVEHDGRFMLRAHEKALQNRWNKLSRAIRRGEYLYIFSHYNDCGQYCVSIVDDFRPERKVLLINDKDITRKQKFRRRLDKWNGPLENDIRKLEEESLRRRELEREAKQIAMKTDNTVLESMHGFWFGLVDNFKYEVASGKCLPRPAQMFRDSRYLLSATPPLVKNIWNEGGLLAFFQGTSMVNENWGSGSFFWLRRRRPNPSLRAAMQRAIVDCTGLVFTAAASYLCANRYKDDCLM